MHASLYYWLWSVAPIPKSYSGDMSYLAVFVMQTKDVCFCEDVPVSLVCVVSESASLLSIIW